MRSDEFIQRMLGVPWSNRACSFDAADCWGLVTLYYRHVLGIEIHHVPGYESNSSFITCFDEQVIFWKRSDIFTDGGIFVAFYGSSPIHVGLTLNGMAFHSRGENGQVRLDQIRTIKKLYTKLEFYHYAANRNTASSGATERESDS